jgi:hypothetical protein
LYFKNTSQSWLVDAASRLIIKSGLYSYKSSSGSIIFSFNKKSKSFGVSESFTAFTFFQIFLKIK